MSVIHVDMCVFLHARAYLWHFRRFRVIRLAPALPRLPRSAPVDLGRPGWA
jgi:hypothetical protein